jgi:endonuclease YncB( thermonuclease family)
MGKRQTLSIQNRNEGNFLICFVIAIVATLGCSNAWTKSSGNAGETTDPPSLPVTASCRSTSEVEKSRPVITGTVVGVSDGDTAIVRDKDSKLRTIRLFAIDAPENGQDFGRASKSYLSSLISNKPICVAIIEKDQYGREVGIIYSDGSDINLAQISAGMAWHFKSYQHQQSANDRWIYSRAEDEARFERRGLWKQGAKAIPPWEYRKLNPTRR